MNLSSVIKNTMLVRRFSKNWIEVSYKILERKPTDVYLKNGIIIRSVKHPFHLIQLLNYGWSISDYSDDVVVMKKEGYTIYCRTTKGYDLGHLIEIFENKTYDYNFKGMTIIDVGASNADSSIFFAINGAKKVIALEPFKESYELGVRNIRANKLEDRITLINAALARNSGIVEFSVSDKNPNANSLLPTDTVKANIVFDTKIHVKALTLKELLEQYNIDRVDLLKMDCEGCEYDVFNGLDPSVLSKINEIILEFHDGLKFLPQVLGSNGFTVTYDHEQGLGILKAKK